MKKETKTNQRFIYKKKNNVKNQKYINGGLTVYKDFFSCCLYGLWVFDFNQVHGFDYHMLYVSR